MLLTLVYQQPSSVSISASDETALANFYKVEQANGTPYRWTTEQSSITFPRLTHAVRIILRLDGSRPIGNPPAVVQVRANNQLVSTITLAAGVADYTLEYRDLSLDPRLTITLLPTTTFYPSDADYRPLGIIFSAARTEPIAELFGLRLPSAGVAMLWLLLSLALAGIAGRSPRTLGLMMALLLATTALLWQLGLAAAWWASFVVILPIGAVALYYCRRALEGWLARLVGKLMGWRGWQIPIVRAGAAPLFYLLATVAFTWPYVLNMGDSIPGWPMDNYNFLYKIWWVSNSLLGHGPAGATLTYNPSVFYPAGYNLAQGELTPANTLLTIPITALFSATVSYNLLVLLSFVLSGWAMYLLVRYLLKPSASPLPNTDGGIVGNVPRLATGVAHTPILIALLCGLAFAFSPYRVAQMGGHLQMLGTQWLPLTFLFLERMVRTRRWQDGAYAGLFFALCCWEAWYYAAIVGLFVVLYVPLRLWQWQRVQSPPEQPTEATSIARTSRELSQVGLVASPAAAPRIIGRAKYLLVFALTVIVLVAPFAVPYVQMNATSGLTYGAKEANENSALPSDYFIPSELHPWWGEVGMNLHREQNLLEQNLYLGLVPLGLLAVALLLWRRGRASVGLRQFPYAAYLLIAGLGFVFSFGLSINWYKLLANWGISVTDHDAALWSPSWLLFQFVPLFSSLRAYARFGLMVIFAVVVVAGLGLALLLASRRFARYPHLVIAALTLLLMLDFAADMNTFGFSKVTSQPQNDWLAQQGDSAPVAFFPADYAQHDGQATWYSVYHGKPIAYGYESFLPALYRKDDVQPPLYDFPSDARVWPLLKQWGVRYVLVSTLWWGPKWPQIKGQLAVDGHLRLVAHFREQPLWRGDVRLWQYWPELEWHAQPDDVWVYELNYLALN